MTHAPQPNSQSVTTRLVQNGLTIVVARAAAMATLLACVPVVISQVGEEGYGFLEALLALVAMATALQSAVAGTVLWQTASYFGSGNREAALRMIRVGVTAALLLAAAATPAIAVLGRVVVERMQVTTPIDLTVSWIILGTVVISLVGGVNQAVLAGVSGFQRAGLAAVAQSVGLMVSNIVLMLAVTYGAGTTAVLWAVSLGAASAFACTYVIASIYCGPRTFMPAWPTREEIRTLLPYAALLLLSALSVVFRDQIDKLILASMDSAATTAHFSMGQRLAGLVLQVCVVLFIPMTASYGSLFGRGDWETICHLYSKWSMWMGALTGSVAVVVITMRSSLITLWLGQDQPAAHFYVGCLIFAATSAIILAGPGVALAKGIGRAGLETTYAMVTLLIVICSKPLAAIWLGPQAAVVCSAISWVCGALVFLGLLHQKLELPSRAARRLLMLWGITGAAAAIGWQLGHSPFLIPDGRLAAVRCLLVFALPVVSAYLATLVALGQLQLPRLGRSFFKTVFTTRTAYDESVANSSA